MMKTRLALASVFILIATSAAGAHDSWISEHQWKSPSGAWCCGTGDCGIVQDTEKSVTTIPGGYHVHGVVQIDGYSPEGNSTFPIDTTIPYGQQLPSPDGQYWICRRADNTARCFFAPTPTY